MTEDETRARLGVMSDDRCRALLAWVRAPWTPLPDDLDTFSVSTGRSATSDTIDLVVCWAGGEPIHPNIERLLSERLRKESE